MNHSDLIDAAARFLHDECRCGLVIREPSTAGWDKQAEIPDAAGWEEHTGLLHIAECKVSMEDLARDAKKEKALEPEFFWYFLGPEIDTPVEIDRCGIVHVNEERICTVTVAAPQNFRKHTDCRSEVRLLLQHILKVSRGDGRKGDMDRHRKWHQQVRQYIKEFPRANAKAIVSYTDHPYKDNRTARTALETDVKRGRVKGVRVDTTMRPAEYYLQGYRATQETS